VGFTSTAQKEAFELVGPLALISGLHVGFARSAEGLLQQGGAHRFRARP